MEQLLQARTRWFKAYFDGDVNALERIEAAEFSTICDAGKLSRQEHLDGIAAAMREGCWFAEGSKKEDANRQMLIFGSTALVTGFSQTVTLGRFMPLEAFTEIWRHVGDDWQAVHLHYSHVKRTT